MSIASRHAGAPYADGETLAGADLESDIANVYAVVNGDIDNSNIAAAANISGTKLADNSVANAKLVNDTITTAKMATGAVVQNFVSSGTAAVTIATASGTWQDMTGVTPGTLTPAAVGDYIVLTLDFTLDNTDPVPFDIGFSVNGTDVGACGRFNTTTIEPQNVRYVATATATTAHVLKPRGKLNSALGTADAPAFSTAAIWTFFAQIFPAK